VSVEVYSARLQAAGQVLAANGLISGSSGNLSMRVKDRLIITRHGSLLAALTASDLIETGIFTDNSTTPLASWELPVHRAIYSATPALSIVHAHPLYAVSLTLGDQQLEMPDGVAVVGMSTEVVPGVLAAEIASELKRHPLVMVRGHGSFAVGETLEAACELSLRFEVSCKHLCLLRSIPLKPGME
jgi:L-fuculose-phosphate aldolase